MDETYILRIYAAAPGTRLQLPEQSGATSAAGHMYYTVTRGSQTQSFGFAPR